MTSLNNKNKRPVSSIITRSTLNNNSDNISKILDGYNNKNAKNLAKIKLKPIIPPIRSITPFNDNFEKNGAKIENNKYNYHLLNKKYNNSINDISDNINDLSINNIQNNYINNKKYFLNEKKNIRQLNINKNKLNNLSQIKTKFVNFIKPNYKNIEMIYNKTNI